MPTHLPGPLVARPGKKDLPKGGSKTLSPIALPAAAQGRQHSFQLGRRYHTRPQLFQQLSLRDHAFVAAIQPGKGTPHVQALPIHCRSRSRRRRVNPVRQPVLGCQGDLLAAARTNLIGWGPANVGEVLSGAVGLLSWLLSGGRVASLNQQGVGRQGGGGALHALAMAMGVVHGGIGSRTSKPRANSLQPAGVLSLQVASVQERMSAELPDMAGPRSFVPVTNPAHHPASSR